MSIKLKIKNLVMVGFIAYNLSLNGQSWPPDGMAGDGLSAATAWQITDTSQLRTLADYVNAGNGKNTNGKYFKLMNDFNLSGYENWKPIGDYAMYPYNNCFQGNFDGNGKVIQDLSINRPTEDNVGFFGLTYKAKIENIGIENCIVVGKNCVGGLVGCNIKNATISNCYATGIINGDSYVGGLVGGNDDSSTISNCHATCDVNGTYIIGGLVGSINYHSTIFNCYATGNVIGIGNGKVGGLVGASSESTISYCNATGSINGGSIIGGLVGTLSSSVIFCCFTTSNVIGESYIGGFAGSGRGTVYNCFATGNVYGNDDRVGGFVGSSMYLIISNCYASGNVNGYNCVGGFIGSNTYSTLRNCIAVNDSVINRSNSDKVNRFAGYDGSTTCNNIYALNTTIVQNSNGDIQITDGSITAGIGKDIATLQSRNFYTTAENWDSSAWDMVTIWDINDGSGLPFLREQGSVGISKIAKNHNISVFPNPTKEQLTIKGIDEQYSLVDYIIYNITGQIIFQGKVQNSSTIDVRHLANGVYYLKICDITVKFVKN